MALDKKLVNLRDLRKAKDLICKNTSIIKVNKVSTNISDIVYIKKLDGSQSSLDLATQIETYNYLVGNVAFIYKNIINGTIIGDDYLYASSASTFLITPESGYMCPKLAKLDIQNANIVSYDRFTGILVLANPKDTVYINITCPIYKATYDIIPNITQGSIVGDTEIEEDGTATVIVTSNEGYLLPEESSIAILNAELQSYDRTTGKIVVKNPTGDVTIKVVCDPIEYSIVNNIVNGRLIGDTTIYRDDSVVLTIEANTGYNLPASTADIAVTNATIDSYDTTTGELVIKNPIGKVTIVAMCNIITYPITGNITNGILTGSSTIPYGWIATVTIQPNEGYNTPADVSSIAVVNATISSYDSTTGNLIISNPTGPVTVTATCNIKVFSITATIINGSYTGPTTINYGTTVTGQISAKSQYLLPDTVTVSGAELISYDSTTGEIVFGNAISNVTLAAKCPIQYAPLAFEAVAASSTVGYRIQGTIKAKLEKSTDGENWTSWDGTAITLTNVGDKVYVRNTVNTLSEGLNSYLNFVMTGKIAAVGALNSLLNYSNISDHCFYHLFYDCTSLVQAPELPATELGIGCYRSCFYNTGITTAPELPATTLTAWCYYEMFGYCAELIEASALPAKVIAAQAYHGIYTNCEKLTKPALMANGEQITSISTNGCQAMYYANKQLKVSNTGSETGSTKFVTFPAGIGYPEVGVMFKYTGGSFADTPVANGTYYYY